MTPPRPVAGIRAIVDAVVWDGWVVKSSPAETGCLLISEPGVCYAIGVSISGCVFQTINQTEASRRLAKLLREALR